MRCLATCSAASCREDMIAHTLQHVSKFSDVGLQASTLLSRLGCLAQKSCWEGHKSAGRGGLVSDAAVGYAGAICACVLQDSFKSFLAGYLLLRRPHLLDRGGGR